MPADSSNVSVGPTLGAMSPPMGIVTTDSLLWWPPGLEDALLHRPVGLRGRERGLGSVATGELVPVQPGIVWHGIPVEWVAELGGDVSPATGSACSELRMGRLPPWLGCGGGALHVEPWEAVIVSPLTGVQVLRGDHNDRSYAVGFSTGVSTSVFTLLSVALSKGDGARTNADYGRTQYDLRLDLRPPVLEACRITVHRARLDRGDPGPDPRLWPEAEAGDPTAPWFWVSQGHGSDDAMWTDDRHSIDRGLLVLQLDVPLRGRLISAAVVKEALDIQRIQSVPLAGGEALLRTARGDMASRRTALLSRLPLVTAEEESLWAGLALERVTRIVELTWSEADSAWEEMVDEEQRRVRAGIGLALPQAEAVVTATTSPRGTSLSWGGIARGEARGLLVEAGAAASGEERRLYDLWQDRIAGADASPENGGTLGSAWLQVTRESAFGDLMVGAVAGWGREIWGWCQDETLAPGTLRRFGPVSCRATGLSAAWYAELAQGVSVQARMRALPWRVGDDPLPNWPGTTGSGTVTLHRALGRAATPRLALVARYVGKRHAGKGGALPLKAFWQVDAQGEVEIGDFNLLFLLENLTGARHQEERGYPVEGLRFRAGFNWLFWD